MPHKLVLLLGIALCVAASWLYWNARDLKSSSIRVLATVDDRSPGGVWTRVPFAPTLTLKYFYGGHEYRRRVNAIDRVYAGLKPGDTVELVLSQKDPGRLMAAESVPASGQLGLTLLIAGALLLFISTKAKG